MEHIYRAYNKSSVLLSIPQYLLYQQKQPFIKIDKMDTSVPQTVFAPQITPVPKSNKSEDPKPSSSSKDHDFPLPKLRLKLEDLSSKGTKIFLASIDPSTAIAEAVQGVCKLLYTSPKTSHTHAPPTRSVTFVIRSMGGVAYTKGSDLDDDHKEIHFSTDYIAGIAESRQTDEILGVIRHEMVHCYQYNGKGACPGGLVEGIADWVRLQSNFSPPHWKKSSDGKWDAGYQHTGYFLDYLETRYGDGTVRRINEKLRTDKYEEKAFWTELLGRPVEQLWGDYGKMLDEEKRKKEEEEMVIVERTEVEDTPSGSAYLERATPTIVAADDEMIDTGDYKPPAGVV